MYFRHRLYFFNIRKFMFSVFYDVYTVIFKFMTTVYPLILNGPNGIVFQIFSQIFKSKVFRQPKFYGKLNGNFSLRAQWASV